MATLSNPSGEFTGPSSGPSVPASKRIVYVSCGATIKLCVDSGDAITSAASQLGWNVTSLDGQGTVSGWLSAFNQAIALKPDAIIEAAITPSAIPDAFARAQQQAIPVVTMFGSGTPGPDASAGVFYNEDTDAAAVGKVMAQAAIADAEGRARVVLLYDNTYALARAKNEAMKQEFAACSSCTVLADISTPFSSIAADAPGLMAGWLNKFGNEPFYVLSVGDIAFDSMVPTLESRGVDTSKVKLIGADGSSSAYDRVRAGKYQIVTVPQPVGEMAYNAMDQLVRAFSSQQPFEWSPAPYLVTKSNVDEAGGQENLYDSGNDYAEKYGALWKQQ